ncbi:MAG: hypothetical protein DME90_01215 [Verrucomicrobia bacterium]|nr:MAG: hypothetical protein DME90_01215 [Verrucomicrobiota bacterium]
MAFEHVRATHEDFVYSPRNCHNLPIRPAIEGDLSRYQIAVKKKPPISSPDASAIQKRRKRLWEKRRSQINGTGLRPTPKTFARHCG